MRILVVEDNAKHLNDARQYSQQLIGCEVDFATTLAEAMELLGSKIYDAAICDVFFPASAGGSAETFDNAIAINIKLVALGVHHVFNTSGNHHGENYRGFLWKTPVAVHNNEISHFLTTGMIIESYPQRDTESDTKQWQAAFRYIILALALLQLPDKGERIIEADDRIYFGFPYGDYGQLTRQFARSDDPFLVETFKKFNA